MSSRRERIALFSAVAALIALVAPRQSAKPASMRSGEPGSGGYFATWPAASPDGALASRIQFQYAGMAHQSDTALSGMWLFLATELLFFGGLFLLYLVYRAAHPQGFAIAAQHTERLIGTVNTILLLTSSAVFSWGLGHMRQGDHRRLVRACLAVIALGTAFLLLKAWEWRGDFAKHLFPGPGFVITGPDSGGAQLFWWFYFAATGLHGLHMIVGLGLVAWIGWAARRGRYSAGYYTPAEAVGLYWSFVDMVWLCLFPMIYL